MTKCYGHEECEFNGQPECRLPDGMECPHGVKADKPAAEGWTDIEALIERLNQYSQSLIAYKMGGEFADVCMDAATALSTLQAENEKLRNEVERQRRSADDRKHLYENAERAYMKVVAELEQVKAERDAAMSWAQKFTESIDRPCVACKHNTGDYVCTAICGNCGPMGTESCKREFDFSGELKED